MQPMKYGYARVSTDSQSMDAQVRQLTKAGARSSAGCSTACSRETR
jgi:DNA invertase Pin-like site-specific DNA recombinase